MQIMPFWINTIGTEKHNLFHLLVSLRIGCTISRHFLDIEQGNYSPSLGQYNDSVLVKKRIHSACLTCGIKLGRMIYSEIPIKHANNT